MQVINPNINIGFKQIQANKKLNKKEPLVLQNSIAHRILMPIASISTMASIGISLHNINEELKDLKRNKWLYLFISLMAVIDCSRKTTVVPHYYGKTNDKKAKNYLITKQALSTALLGSLITCGISQAINKNADRKSGIMAACLAGIALAGATISNIATWKNYKSMEKSDSIA